jgi:hypothetical protein
VLLNIVLRTRRIQSGCRGGPVRLEEGVARYEGFSVGFPRLSSPRGPRTGATNPTCNHRRTGSSFHVLGSRSDFASFGAEHSSGPREVGHHPATRLHAWVTLSPRGAAVWRLLLTLVLTYRASGRAENSYFLPAAVPLLAALLAALLARCSLGQYRCALRYNTNKGWTWKAPVGMRLSGDLRRDREF